MNNRQPGYILPLSVLLLSIAISAPAAVHADPLGQLVNLIMNKILDERDKKEEPVRQNFAGAPNRAIPQDSQTGTLTPLNDQRNIKIDGDSYELAFNSRIRDEGNRIVPVNAIRNAKRVRYTLNPQKQVNKIWFLAAGEQ